MRVDVFNSFLTMNNYLRAKRILIDPVGVYLHVVDMDSKNILGVYDTIEEINDWVKDKFGENLLKEAV